MPFSTSLFANHGRWEREGQVYYLVNGVTLTDLTPCWGRLPHPGKPSRDECIPGPQQCPQGEGQQGAFTPRSHAGGLVVFGRLCRKNAIFLIRRTLTRLGRLCRLCRRALF